MTEVRLPSFYCVEDVPSFDSFTERSIPIEVPTGENVNLNTNQCIRFKYSGEEFIRLGSSKSGFRVRTRFITKNRDAADAAFANNEDANITLESNWFHHIFSRYEVKLGNSPLEIINSPGECIDIISHLKGLDYRQISGENYGFIPDTNNGDATKSMNTTGNTQALINTAFNTWFNEGFSRRFKKYNYDVANNDTWREFEMFIPLNLMFGFCADYDKVIKYIPISIELTRKTNTEIEKAVFGSANTSMQLELTELTLLLDSYIPKPELQLTLDKRFENGPVEVCFRKRELQVTQSNQRKLTINVDGLKVPRFCFIICKGAGEGAANNAVLQEQIDMNYSLCRHCNIRDIRISLDGKWYPDKAFNANFSENKYSHFYDAYAQVCLEFAGSVGLTPNEFKNLYSIFCIDLSDQKDKAANTLTTFSIEIERNAVPTEAAQTAQNPRLVNYYVLVLDEATFSVDMKKKTAVAI